MDEEHARAVSLDMHDMTGTNDLFVGIDIGGTFTDVVVVRRSGEIFIEKAPTTPLSLDGLFAALDKVSTRLGIDTDELLSRTIKLVYGSTFATNTVIERKGSKVAGLTTEGFGDTLLIRRMMRNSVYDLHEPFPTLFLKRRDTFEIEERISHEGEVVKKLDKAQLRDVAESVAKRGYEAVAICLLHSYRNPDHEEMIAGELLRAGDLFVSQSHRVISETREFERFSTTVMNAYLGPKSQKHLQEFESRVRGRGLQPRPLIMQSSGGVSSVGEVLDRPISLLLSGPVGGVLATQAMASALKIGNLITLDMGGTSSDVGIVADGQLETATVGEIDQWPIMSRRVAIHAVGAGGGSIARCDDFGKIKVGPDSAGAHPGPACYGQGGSDVTVTDADLVMGLLNGQRFLGGSMPLDSDLATQALEINIGSKIKSSPTEAAGAVFEIVNARMVDAIRHVTVLKGHDPRDFWLVAYGGAGPLHAAALHRELGTAGVIIPNMAPVLSAFGVVTADLRHSYVRACRVPLDEMDFTEIQILFESMEKEGRDVLLAEGVDPDAILLQPSADLMYEGQIHELNIPIPAYPLDDASKDAIKDAFIREYSRLFGARDERLAIQILNIRMEAVGAMTAPELPRVEVGTEDPAAAFEGKRRVYLREATVEARIYAGNRLQANNVIPGPAIIEYASTTVLILMGQSGKVDEWGNVAITEREDFRQ